MTFEAFVAYSKQIVDGTILPETYNDPLYLEFAKLNTTRTNRWIKTFEIPEEYKVKIKAIKEPQNWILITEPWCGDAAHIVPIIHLLSKENDNIHLDIQLRDEEPFLINDYLTNGGKSIPILIIRDEAGKDKAVWGPRPKSATALFNELKANNASFDDLKIALQKWYNDDKANEICIEITTIANK